MKNSAAGVRYDRKTSQYIPTINGIDLSPTSFDESRALQIARQAIEFGKQKEIAYLREREINQN